MRVLFAVAVAAMAALGLTAHKWTFAHPKPLAMSTVLVSDDGGHGSGVHIGNGYIVTAAHVVENKSEMTITGSDGKDVKGTVLWSNKDYDVALIRVADHENLAKSHLACHPSFAIGERIEAVGNPVNLKWVHTWGWVSSDISERGPWKLSVLADLAVGPGMSGGPVFDRRGNVIGIAVGISITLLGLYPSIYGVSYIVPSQAICTLLASESME